MRVVGEKMVETMVFPQRNDPLTMIARRQRKIMACEKKKALDGSWVRR
jgi:hypothetical protein